MIGNNNNFLGEGLTVAAGVKGLNSFSYIPFSLSSSGCYVNEQAEMQRENIVNLLLEWNTGCPVNTGGRRSTEGINNKWTSVFY